MTAKNNRCSIFLKQIKHLKMDLNKPPSAYKEELGKLL
jgi:hypothetical protein